MMMMVIMVMVITWILKGLLLPVVGVAGVVGNAISLVVIHKVSRAAHKSQLLINTEIENLFNEKKSQADLRLKASFLRLVTALSLYDTVDIIIIIIFSSSFGLFYDMSVFFQPLYLNLILVHIFQPHVITKFNYRN